MKLIPAILACLLVCSELQGQTVFGPPTVIFNDTVQPSEYLGFYSIITGDFNGDAYEDIIASAIGGFGPFILDVLLFTNDGIGGFNGPTIPVDSVIAAGRRPADYDGDGDLDFLTITNYDAKIRLWRNDGNAAFSGGTVVFNDTTLSNPIFSKIEPYDLDDDGDEDILFASEDPNTPKWFENDGTGNFSVRTLVSELVEDPSDLIAADIDGDGDKDLIIASSSDNENINNIVWYENDGAENFGSANIVAGQAYGTNDLEIADLNLDGYPDIVASLSYSSEYVFWYANDGNGNFQGPYYILETADQYFNSIRTADLDNDGDMDVLLSTQNGNNLSWFENDGIGGFSSQMIIGSDINGHYGMQVADLDNDGDLDIAVNMSVTAGIVWFENLLGDDITAISGRIYWDINGDTIYTDTIDRTWPGMALELEPGGITYYSSSDGSYIMYVSDSVSYSLFAPAPAYPDCSGWLSFDPVIPDSAYFTFDFAPFAEIEQDFVFSAVPNCRTINGRLFNDLNANGVEDGGDEGASGIRIVAEADDRSYAAFTNVFGDYSISLPAGESVSLHLDPDFPLTNGYCGHSMVISVTPTFPAEGSYEIGETAPIFLDTLDFGAGIETLNTYDVGIYSLRVDGGNSAGGVFNAWMDFKASGNITSACTLRIEHDPNLTLQYSDIPITSSSAAFTEWVFPPGSAPTAYCLQMQWYLDSMAVAGDTLHWHASYLCDQDEDACPDNNEYFRSVPILNGPLRLADDDCRLLSMRPEGPMPEIIQPGEVLSYVVSFKNPLSTNAYDVTIVDQLSPFLDWNTVSRPFSSYPDYDFSINSTGRMVLQLNGTNLSDAAVDELNSYGFVQFNVTVREDVPANTVIPNSATVLFNHHNPITTNEVIHRTAGVSSPGDELFTTMGARIFPNPFHRHVKIQFEDLPANNFDIEVSDLLGRKVMCFREYAQREITIDGSGWTPGLYVLNVYASGSSRLLGTWKLISR